MTVFLPLPTGHSENISSLYRGGPRDRMSIRSFIRPESAEKYRWRPSVHPPSSARSETTCFPESRSSPHHPRQRKAYPGWRPIKPSRRGNRLLCSGQNRVKYSPSGWTTFAGGRAGVPSIRVYALPGLRFRPNGTGPTADAHREVKDAHIPRRDPFPDPVRYL